MMWLDRAAPAAAWTNGRIDLMDFLLIPGFGRTIRVGRGRRGSRVGWAHRADRDAARHEFGGSGPHGNPPTRSVGALVAAVDAAGPPGRARRSGGAEQRAGRARRNGRPEPPLRAAEANTILGFLDFLRATVAWKCDGLDAAGLATTAPPPR